MTKERIHGLHWFLPPWADAVQETGSLKDMSALAYKPKDPRMSPAMYICAWKYDLARHGVVVV